MWYRFAIDLKDLNREFSDEKKVTDIISNLESGNDYSSGSINVRKVEPREPESVESMHLDFDKLFDTDPQTFHMSLRNLLDHTISNYENGKFVKRDRQGVINHFISLSGTLSSFIDSGVLGIFQEKLRSFNLILEDLLVKASDYMKDESVIGPRFQRIREIALSDFDLMSEEEKSRLLVEKEELYKQQENSAYRVISEEDLKVARFVFMQISKLIGEMYSRINLENGRKQWVEDMIRYSIPLNFLPEFDSYNDNGNVIEFNPKELYVERVNRR